MKRFLVCLLTICSLLCIGCKDTNGINDNYVMSIIAPNGAPSVAVAQLVTEYEDDYNATLGLEASTLQPAFAAKDNDVIIAPINLGANMYSKTQSYQLAAVLTWGNLYFASQKADFKLADLNGASVIFFGEGTINDVVVQYVLKENNIVPANIEYKGSTQLTQEQLLAKDDAIVLVAEPALSAAKIKDSDITAISVQDLYKEASGNKNFPQAGCFIKTETINNHKSVVDLFIDRLEASADATNNDPATVAGYAVALNVGTPAAVLTKAIPNCNINFVKANDARSAIELAVTLKPALFGGANPVDGFYYA